MRISIAQLNYKIGDFAGNKELIINAISKARNYRADLIVFSELCIPGYPPLDLLHRIDFIEKCNITAGEIAAECRDLTAIVGCPTFNKGSEGKKLYNSALVLSGGRIIFQANKALLPTYDIFDEYRYFEPEKQFGIFHFKGLRIALTICEDLWDEQPFENKFEKTRLYTISPMEELSKENPDLIINISASPFSYTKTETRKKVFTSKAARYNIPVITSNQTGANTELIFDGASLVINREGRICRQLGYFEEMVETFDLDQILECTEDSQEKMPGQL